MEISRINNSPNFSGVTPVRIYQNGKEVLDNSVVRNTCSKLIKAFGGPLENKYKPAAAQFAVRDPEYTYSIALRGYPNTFIKKDSVPSDYIKTIYDKNNRGYLVTGELSQRLSEYGHEIGKASKDAAKKEQAIQKYFDFVKQIGNNLRYRIKEAFNKFSNEKYGEFEEMVVDITTKPYKSKGKTVEKVTLQNISFRNVKK